MILYSISKANSSLLNGPKVELNWSLLLEEFLSAEETLKFSEISLHLVSEMQSDTPLNRDQLLALLAQVKQTDSTFSHERLKKVIKLM